jgi:lipopolysaccharide transport system permease protein
LLQAMGFGIGLLLGTLNVFFRDIAQLLTVALQVVMWTAPIVYAADALPTSLQTIIRWHPIMPALGAVRSLFLHGQPPTVTDWLGMMAWPAGLLVVAGFVFGQLRHEIRDVL